jgi:hypothetical protein
MSENRNTPNNDQKNNQSNNNNNKKNLRGLFVLLGWALVLTIVINFLSDYSHQANVAATTHEIMYSEFIDLVEDGKVAPLLDAVRELDKTTQLQGIRAFVWEITDMM